MIVFHTKKELIILNTGRNGFPVFAVTRTLLNTSPVGKEWVIVHPCCQERIRHDKRTPGLFKVEWEDEGLSGCARKRTIVSGPKINTVQRG